MEFDLEEREIKFKFSMDCDRKGPLKDEYLFFDGTFKRCSGFITLCGHVFMNVSGQIVKFLL